MFTKARADEMAEELDQIQWDSDYEYITVPVGDQFIVALLDRRDYSVSLSITNFEEYVAHKNDLAEGDN